MEIPEDYFQDPLEPYLDRIICGDAVEVLKQLPSDSIDCIITSPPYWGLRDYGKENNRIWDGDPTCEHEFGQTGFCKKCGAWYGQLGLEPTLDLYLNHLLQITKELKRVLKPTGVLFWNHGDSYGGSHQGKGAKEPSETGIQKPAGIDPRYPSRTPLIDAPKKCMTLQNYRLALRMIEEQGWILRNVLIWYKPNHMPSSAKDRFTNTYEPIFVFTKSDKYYFDLDAVRVPLTEAGIERMKHPVGAFGSDPNNPLGRLGKGITGGFTKPKLLDYQKYKALGRNPGDLWWVPTADFHDAHFAVFPERLRAPLIEVGCPRWICKRCGKARERIVETPKKGSTPKEGKYKGTGLDGGLPNDCRFIGKVIGWTDCGCNAGWEPGIVLDPFCGSGTACLVARKLGRHFIGIDINPKYVEMAEKRIKKLGKPLLESLRKS